ncbi:MFS-type transporter SLC18B1 [Orchesella cincta]|uniref:MFS-type transporter SLC18B1 n=1 Tax=Orchesella cincta TaxID=48709 RepID=A0A1D2N007_ORCCI|nr:MFS-type transporter SLC18B1 [Orchesella cincta]
MNSMQANSEERPNPTPSEICVKEYLASASESDDDQDSEAESRLDPNRDYTRNRTTSRVSFTIGDSSDCESQSTIASSISTRDVLNHGEEVHDDDDNDANPCNHNKWHKYHFHDGVPSDVDHDDGKFVRNSAVSASASSQIGNKLVLGSFQRRKSENMDAVDSLYDSPTTRMNVDSDHFSVRRLTDVDEDDSNVEGNKRNTNWRKWRILVACAMVQLFAGLTISLQAPFYPAEAERKGATATAYGFVFGVFELTVFIVTPFYAYKIHKWNLKLVFNFGIFTAAIASIIFGILDKIENGTYFIAASVIVRSIEAVGESALVTACFVIVASAFPDSVAPTSAILETFYSMAGLGAYSRLNFIRIGGCLLATAFLAFVILPSSEEISRFQGAESIVISSHKSFKLLKSSAVAVSAICIVTAAMSIAYLQATLEPHLRHFEISQLTTGAILVINGGIYTMTAPFWGLFCDKILQLKVVTFTGAAVLLCGFSLIGPVPFFPFKPDLWIVSLGLGIQGIGLSAVLVSSFVSILRNVINSGFPDTPSTYGLVSSLVASMFSLGSFIGPSLSGILFDAVGFQWGTLSVIIIILIMMCALLIFVCTSTSEMDSFVQSESEPLLNTTTFSTSVYSSDHQPSSSSAMKHKQQGPSYGSIKV